VPTVRLAPADGSHAAAACTPSGLIAQFQAPEQNQVLQTAQAQTLRVLVQDDCGNPLTGAGRAARVTFGNGDAPVVLSDEGNGIWAGTWTPVTAQTLIKAQVDAFLAPSTGAILTGEATVTGLTVVPAGNDSSAGSAERGHLR
jgi:hypothetical protein